MAQEMMSTAMFSNQAELNLHPLLLKDMMEAAQGDNQSNHYEDAPLLEEFEEEDQMIEDQFDIEEDDFNIERNDQLLEDYYEEEEELNEDDDTFLLEEPVEREIRAISPSHPTVSDPSNILICTDPPFTEQDLDNFLNYAPNENVDITSETSYHSTSNSIHSSSSMVLKIENLGMSIKSISTSNSSKRKTSDGIDDAASSGVTHGNKPKL